MLTHLKNFVTRLLSDPRRLSQAVIIGFLVIGTVNLAMKFEAGTASTLRAQNVGDQVAAPLPTDNTNPAAETTQSAGASNTQLNATNCSATKVNGIYTTKDLQDKNCVLSCLQDRQLEAQAERKKITTQIGGKAAVFLENFNNSFAGMLPGISYELNDNNQVMIPGVTGNPNRKDFLVWQTTKRYAELQYCLPIKSPKVEEDTGKITRKQFAQDLNEENYKEAYGAMLGSPTYIGTSIDVDRAYQIIMRDVDRQQIKIAKTIDRAIKKANTLDTATIKQISNNTSATANIMANFARWRIDIARKLQGAADFNQIWSQGQSASLTNGTVYNKMTNLPWPQIMGKAEEAKLLKAEAEERMKASKILLEDVKNIANSSNTTDPETKAALDNLDMDQVTNDTIAACTVTARDLVGGIRERNTAGLDYDEELNMVLTNVKGEPIDLSGKPLPAGSDPIPVLLRPGSQPQWNDQSADGGDWTFYLPVPISIDAENNITELSWTLLRDKKGNGLPIYNGDSANWYIPYMALAPLEDQDLQSMRVKLENAPVDENGRSISELLAYVKIIENGDLKKVTRLEGRLQLAPIVMRDSSGKLTGALGTGIYDPVGEAAYHAWIPAIDRIMNFGEGDFEKLGTTTLDEMYDLLGNQKYVNEYITSKTTPPPPPGGPGTPAVDYTGWSKAKCIAEAANNEFECHRKGGNISSANVAYCANVVGKSSRDPKAIQCMRNLR